MCVGNHGKRRGSSEQTAMRGVPVVSGVKALKAGVRRGEWSGWRLITVHQQSIGNEE